MMRRQRTVETYKVHNLFRRKNCRPGMTIHLANAGLKDKKWPGSRLDYTLKK